MIGYYDLLDKKKKGILVDTRHLEVQLAHLNNLLVELEKSQSIYEQINTLPSSEFIQEFLTSDLCVTLSQHPIFPQFP